MNIIQVILILVSFSLSQSVLSADKKTPVSTQLQEVKAEPTNAELMHKLILDIDLIESKIKDKFENIDSLQGEERALSGLQILEHDKEITLKIDSAVKLLLDMKKEGEEVGDSVTILHRHLNRRNKQLSKIYKYMITRLEEVNKEAVSVEVDDRFKFEQKINKARVILSDIFLAFQKIIETKALLGVDNSHDIWVFSDLMKSTSNDSASRLRLVSDQIKNKKNEISNSGDEGKKSLSFELNSLNEKRKGIIDGLSIIITLMQKHDLDTTKLSQLLITSSGTINQQIFDREVIAGLFVQMKGELDKWFKLNASSFIVSALIIIFILIIFRLLSLLIGRLLKKAIDSSKVKVSRLLQEFFVVSIKRIVMFIGVLIALSQTGVQLGPLLAGLGVLGFVVGFALQGVLSNFASGLMILIYRPYDVGDVVEIAKVKGTVKEMSMVSTTMLSFNNERLVIPNNSIWGSLIRNITSETTRRVDLVFKISFDADIDQVEKIFNEEISAIAAILVNPKPIIQLHKQHETHYEFIVRPWVNTADYWSTYWALQRSINKRMSKEGVPKLNPYEFLKPLINKV
jgi:small conductance mechanosensitive channel